MIHFTSLKIFASVSALTLVASCSGAGTPSKFNGSIGSTTASSSMAAESVDAMSAAGGPVRVDASAFQYNGWSNNIDGMTNRGNIGAVVRSIARQIDIVENSWLLQIR